ncbi:hypothetical protein RRG08_009682 [Elysia crispata]|uniref:Uncharacterized protein n=1 Tax=Elysia crispata TaxID=231223 RepID=A0AAE1AJ07_9GAST|nr:hypothetical protein RRG08_009682 [Elysia crispata]
MHSWTSIDSMFCLLSVDQLLASTSSPCHRLHQYDDPSSMSLVPQLIYAVYLPPAPKLEMPMPYDSFYEEMKKGFKPTVLIQFCLQPHPRPPYPILRCPTMGPSVNAIAYRLFLALFSRSSRKYPYVLTLWPIFPWTHETFPM